MEIHSFCKILPVPVITSPRNRLHDFENQVLLVGGKCQNLFADGSDEICGKALGAHPGNYFKKINHFHRIFPIFAFDEIYHYLMI
jgi:hypothetical protein